MSSMTREGQPCRKCGTAVELVVRTAIPKRRARDSYYFDYWLKCGGCGTIYYREDGKRVYLRRDGLEVRL